MRVELSEKFQKETNFERGDYALVVIKEEKIILIETCEENNLTDDINDEILDMAEHGAKVYEVQFLSNKEFSMGLPLNLDFNTYNI